MPCMPRTQVDLTCRVFTWVNVRTTAHPGLSKGRCGVCRGWQGYGRQTEGNWGGECGDQEAQEWREEGREEARRVWVVGV